MTLRTEIVAEIVSLRTSTLGLSLYDCIMAIVDVSDLDNDEIEALEADLNFGAAAREITLIEGNV